MDSKPWYLSKTFYINIIALVGMIVQSKWGWVLQPEREMLVLGIVNMILRTVTKKPVAWK